jgi:hypothetical protein
MSVNRVRTKYNRVETKQSRAEHTCMELHGQCIHAWAEDSVWQMVWRSPGLDPWQLYPLESFHLRAALEFSIVIFVLIVWQCGT